MNKITTIKDAAEELLEKNGVVTTLEIKNYLRKKFPARQWTQALISQVMQAVFQLQKIVGLNFYDNGTYREYYIGSKKPSQPVKGKKSKTTKSKTNMKVATISRTNAIDKILNSKGRFFTVSWTKKNGEPRTLNCQKAAGADVTPFGYIRVNRTARKGQALVDTRTINQLSIGNNVYKVRV